MYFVLRNNTTPKSESVCLGYEKLATYLFSTERKVASVKLVSYNNPITLIKQGFISPQL